jgi:hypothetical protein
MEETRRIYILEESLRRLYRDMLDAQHRLARIEQMLSQLAAGSGGPSSGGGGSLYWCRTPGSVAAASGTWPAITPSTFTADVYIDAGGLTLQYSGATIRWFYKDTEVVNKLVPCMSNNDGTFDAIASSCTAV